MKYGTEVGPRLTFLLGTLLAIIGCGGGAPPAPAPISPPLNYTPNGNWLLVGNQAEEQYPIISAALIVSGNQVIASGLMETACGAGIGEYPFYLTGPVAPGGSFQLASVPPDASITISGVLPASGATTWSGTYTDNCGFNQSGPFTATVLPALNGTYEGTLQAGSATTGQGITVTFSQGAATSATNGGFTLYYLPSSVTVTITGSPCFTHGTSIAGYSTYYGPSEIYGAGVYGAALMDNGSQLSFLGTLSVPDESTLLFNLGAPGGACNGTNYSATLTRQ
jgi:hypothetical protein